MVLSMGWGLYVYKNAIIPLYVSPGHAVFYSLAVVTARERRLQAHAPAITRAVLILGSLYASASFLFLHDTRGTLWWLIASILIIRILDLLSLPIPPTAISPSPRPATSPPN